MPPLRTIGTLLVLTAIATAQDWRAVDGPHRMMPGAFDTFANRVVAVASGRETREWDGAHWLARPLPLLPAMPTCMAFDDGRGVTVAVVWPSLLAPTLDTWESDGTAWVLRTPVTSLPRLLNSRCVYDAARGRTVFVGADTPGGTFSTWEWDGQNWLQRPTPAALTGRLSVALAYDAARARTVMFGGLGAGGVFGTALAETWEWDGVAWVQRTLPTSPSARAAAAMAYDASRQVCVLFGGTAVADTWEYDGVTWTQRVGAMPPARSYPGLVHDRQRGVTVLFDGSGAAGYLDDVWQWDGVAWTQQLATVQPSSFLNPALAYSATRDRLVMFGGDLGAGGANQTWEWDGRDWARIPLPTPLSPPARVSHSMWSDGTDVFVFGGNQPGSAAGWNDTWRWNGLAWSAAAAAPGPSARARAAVSFEPTTGGALLFGGAIGINPGTFFGDTWRLQAGVWTQLTVTPSPAPRVGAGIATDLARQRVVLWGGNGPAGYLDDTWEWDGTAWLLQNPPHRPPVSGVQSMAYESDLGAVVLVTRPSTILASMETWLWLGSDWLRLDTPTRLNTGVGIQVVAAPGRVFAHDMEHLYQLTAPPPLVANYGSACQVATLRLGAEVWPRPGANDFALTTSGQLANAPVLFVVGLAAASLPVGGCTLLVQPGGPLVASVADAHGICTLPLPLPPVAALVGLRAFAQAWSLAPGGLAATRGLDVTVGL